MKPIRGKQHVEVHQDAVTGHMRILRKSVEEDVLSTDGSLDSQVTEEVFFSDCGCRTTAAGRCELCHALSCADCHGRCVLCKIPVCLQCSVFANNPQDGQQIRFCKRCHDQSRRQRRLTGIVKAVLSPFIRFEGDHENNR